MPRKLYQTIENEPMAASEPAVAYEIAVSEVSLNSWNPNVPFHGTQEEWWEHFHKIEQGNFMTIEEADIKFEEWKKEYLAKKGIKYRQDSQCS